MISKKEEKSINDMVEKNIIFPYMNDKDLFKHMNKHKRLCYQEKLSMCVHPDFLPTYDNLDDDVKDRIMATISVLLVVKQPNGLGYDIGKNMTVAIDIGRKYRILYFVDRPSRVLTLYCIDKNCQDRQFKLPKNCGWNNTFKKEIEFYEEWADDTPIHKKCSFDSMVEMYRYGEQHGLTGNELLKIRIGE